MFYIWFFKGFPEEYNKSNTFRLGVDAKIFLSQNLICNKKDADIKLSEYVWTCPYMQWIVSILIAVVSMAQLNLY